MATARVRGDIKEAVASSGRGGQRQEGRVLLQHSHSLLSGLSHELDHGSSREATMPDSTLEMSAKGSGRCGRSCSLIGETLHRMNTLGSLLKTRVLEAQGSDQMPVEVPPKPTKCGEASSVQALVVGVPGRVFGQILVFH